MTTSEFEQTVQSYISAHRLLRCNDEPVLVTLSGGADSVALLRVLTALGYQCIAAHCNFHLRGDESDRDERFVVNLCQQLEVPLKVQHMDVPAYQKEHSVSVEMACRELRYDWFWDIAGELGCQGIAVAHHRDDNVETFFLNSLRGSGIAGLVGMRPRNGLVVRPMLGVSRQDVEQYLVNLGQPYVTDSTNLENDYKRNRIRNLVMPVLEEQFPGAAARIADTMDHVRDHDELYQDLLGGYRLDLAYSEGDVIRVRLPKFMMCGVSRLGLLLHSIAAGECGFSHEKCEQLVALARKGKSKGQRFYSKTHTMSLTPDFIIIEPTRQVEDKEIVLDLNGLLTQEHPVTATRCNGKKFTRSMVDGKCRIAMPVSAIEGRRIVLRHWRRGDRMHPFGTRYSKLVSDIFTDSKVTPESRRAAWLLEVDGEVVWVMGVRCSNKCLVGPEDMYNYVILSSVDD